MDDFDQYDEFGNYIGPGLDLELQNASELLMGDNNPQFLNPHVLNQQQQDNLSTTDKSPTISTTASARTTTTTTTTTNNNNHNNYDSSVEVIVATHDAHATSQSLMQASRAMNFDDSPSANNQQFTGAGYGSVNDYQASFCIPETILPPLSIAKHSTYPQLILDLLSEQWLQRQFTVIGGHLHGKTALLDLFFTQLHPHINLQSVTPRTPSLNGTPHNLKPTSSFSGTFNPSSNKGNATNAEPTAGNNRLLDCWPVQYADSLYRERAIGHSTGLKPITIPIEVPTPLIDAHSQHFSADFHNPLPTKTYLFSITDTPAQSDYIDHTVLAIQRCSGSGVVLVVDVVEGMTAEIELQLEYAIRHASPMLLVISKMDRLITELRVPPQDAYVKIANVIEAVNMAVLQYYNMYYGLSSTGEPQPKDGMLTATRYRCPLFNPVEHNVVFTSTLHSWAFTIKSFAMLYLTEQDIKVARGVGPLPSSSSPPQPTNFNTNSTNAQKLHKLIHLLWGNIYYDVNTHQFISKPPQQNNTQSSGANKTTGFRTFVDFILMPLYKIYSACLTGSAMYLETILGSFYQPLPLSQGKTLTPFAIPPHILASSQDDLLREIVGLWLFAPFHLSTIHERSQGGYNPEEFSIFSNNKNLVKSQSHIPSTNLPSNANCAAKLLAASILDVLPPPVLRKSFLQQTTLLYQPPLQLGPTPDLSALHAQQSQLTQTQPQTKDNEPQLKPLSLPQQKYFPPCRAGLADIVAVMPHPNGTTLDFLCKVHTLSINNDPLFVEQSEEEDLHGSARARVAFALGDKITLFRSEDKSYSPPHQLVGIFAPCANRYRIPIHQCYDGNLVVLSFSTQSSNPGSQPSSPLTPPQPDSTLLNKFRLTGHGTFINNTITLLGQSQRSIKGPSTNQPQQQSSSPRTTQLEQLDLRNFIPTFTRPIIHPGNDTLNIAIEPTVASELPILLSSLHRAQSIYGSSLKITKEITGTHTLSMRGESIADDIIHYLRVVTGNSSIASTIGQQDKRKIVPPNLQQLSFAISTPFYNFREGIAGQSATECTATSLGAHNAITATAYNATPDSSSNVLPDQQPFAQSQRIHFDNTYLTKQYQNYLNWSSRKDSMHIIEPTHIAKSMNLQTSAHVGEFNSRVQRNDRESMVFGSNRLFSTFHVANKLWDSISQTQTPWSFGLLDDANVKLLDTSTRGSHVRDDDVQNAPFLSSTDWKFDHIASIVNGFNRLVLEGPLTESPLHNMTLELDEINISSNPLQATARHIVPTAHKALSGSILLANPVLYEPMTRGEIIINKKFDPEVVKLLGSRRGLILTKIPIPLTPYTRYVYKLPTIESTGFGVDVRVIAKGQSRLSGSYHLCYERLTGDPLDSSIPVSVVKIADLQDLPRDLMVKTRRRKGLPEFDVLDYFDQAMFELLGTS